MSYSDFTISAGFLTTLAFVCLTFSFVERRAASERPRARLFMTLGGLQLVTLIGLMLLAPLLDSPFLLLIVGGVLLFNAPLLFGPR